MPIAKLVKLYYQLLRTTEPTLSLKDFVNSFRYACIAVGLLALQARASNVESAWNDQLCESLLVAKLILPGAPGSYIDSKNADLIPLRALENTSFEDFYANFLSDIHFVNSHNNPKGVRAIFDSKNRSLSYLKNINARGGIGYLTSSLHHNENVEAYWTAKVAKTLIDSGRHPLIISVDEAYLTSQATSVIVMAQKLTKLGYVKDSNGRNYVIVITGVSRSVLFTENILRQIPSREHLESSLAAEPYFRALNGTLALNQSQVFFGKSMAENITKLAQLVKQKTGTSPDSECIKLWLQFYILNHDVDWQSLWYEYTDNSGLGVPVYIVAPESFHSAIDRMHDNWTKSPHDYRYRSSHSLGGNIMPAIDSIDEKVMLSGELLEYLRPKQGDTPESSKLLNYPRRGISPQEFKRRTQHIVDALLVH